MISLRKYQQECVESILFSKDRGINRPLISLATGLGKTVVFSDVARRLNLRTLIIAHRDELIRQAKEKIELIWPEVASNIGIVKGELHEPDKQVVIASIQSAARDRRLADLKRSGFDLCIIDEAHHSAAPTYERLVRDLGFLTDDPRKLLLGVTATPKRGDGVGLSSIFQEIVFSRSIAWGIRNGYLSPLVGKKVSTRVSLKGVQTQAGDFVASQLSLTINVPGRNKLIVESFLEYAKDRKKAIAFCADVQHATDLAFAFNSSGIPSSAIHGKMSIETRRQVLQDFEEGRIQVLTNCGVLTEGFDSPAVDTIFLCRPTQSQGLYVQCVGRGTRVSPGKKNCLVIDFVDASRLGLCNFVNSLEGAVSPIFEEAREKRDLAIEDPYAITNVDSSFEASDVQEIDFFGRSQFAWIQIGDSWHLPVSYKKDVWVNKSNKGYRAVLHADGQTLLLSDQDMPLDYAVGFVEDWMRSQTTNALSRKDAPWRNEAASEKQLATLEKFGIRERKMTKGEASDLLQVKFHGANGRFRIESRI
jgi:superfamily II DNA or RNA helicase